MRRVLFVLFISVGLGSFAQNATQLNKDSLHKEPFLNTVEQSLNLFYSEYANDFNVDSLKKAIEENQAEIIQLLKDAGAAYSIKEAFAANATSHLPDVRSKLTSSCVL